VAVAANGKSAYVTVLNDEVDVINTADNKVIGTVSVGGDPQGVGVGEVPKVEYVAPGSSWTLQVEAGFCEVQTFHAGGTWTSDNDGDAGKWTGGGNSLSEEYTAGYENGGYVATTYSTASKEYSGTAFSQEMSFQVTLTAGKKAGC
jgi:YVTN family beta-propeller protein